MMRSLLVQIEAGPKACEKSPGKRCSFVRQSSFGAYSSQFHCGLFSRLDGNLVSLTPLAYADGSPQRHQDCLAAERAMMEYEIELSK